MSNNGKCDFFADDNKKKKDKKEKKKGGGETREATLAMLSVFNRRTFKDCLEFDLTKLIGLVNDMLRTRYAYVFNSEHGDKFIDGDDH